MRKQTTMSFEFTDGVDDLYFSNNEYLSAVADIPSAVPFEARIVGSVDMTRSISTQFWNGKPRGTMNLSVLRIANGDGKYDYLEQIDMRDTPFIIKLGYVDSAFSTFTTIVTGLIDRIDFTEEDFMTVYLRGNTARLDRAAQQSVYPTGTTNKSLVGQSRPCIFGRVRQVPLTQPSPLGFGDYDIHDSDRFIGITSFYDKGMPISENGVARSSNAAVFGVVRLTQPADSAKQCVDAIGEYRTLSTPINEGFANLTNFTETNGGVGGRDASISSNRLSVVNTAGGADLTLQHNTAVVLSDTAIAYFEFEVISHGGTPVSDSARLEFRAGGVAHATITGPGKYRGIIRNNANVNVAFVAMNGCNCTTVIDNLVVRLVEPLESLLDYVEYFATSGNTGVTGKGPLAYSDLGSSVSTLSASLGYTFNKFLNTPQTCADLLDELAYSIGGFWYEDATGKLQIRQLLDPSGTAVMSFNTENIKTGMSSDFDQAEGLTDIISSGRNYSPYTEDELSGFLSFVSLSIDRGPRLSADAMLTSNNYTYTMAATGSVLCSADLPGGKYYFEVTPSATTVAGHRIGTNSPAQPVTSAPGSANGSVAYRNDGQSVVSGSTAAYGNSYTNGDVVGCIRNSEYSLAGARLRANRVWFMKNGLIQNSGNTNPETGFLVAPSGSVAIAAPAVGATAAANAGTVNFGQSDFVHAIPDDYVAPAHLKGLLQRDFRFSYQSTIPLASCYSSALAASNTRQNINQPKYGTGTNLTRMSDTRTEGARWNALFSSLRRIIKFTAALDGFTAATLTPGDLIEVTYPRYSLSATPVRIRSIGGDITGGEITIEAWR